MSKDLIVKVACQVWMTILNKRTWEFSWRPYCKELVATTAAFCKHFKGTKFVCQGLEVSAQGQM